MFPERTLAKGARLSISREVVDDKPVVVHIAQDADESTLFFSKKRNNKIDHQ